MKSLSEAGSLNAKAFNLVLRVREADASIKPGVSGANPGKSYGETLKPAAAGDSVLLRVPYLSI